MGKDYVSLTECAITSTGNLIDRSRLVFSGHSKGAYVASIATGLATKLQPSLVPKSAVLFAMAGFDAASAASVSSATAVTIVFSDADTVVKKSFTEDYFAAIPSTHKQIITLKSYPADAAKSGTKADHFWPMTKGSFAGGGALGPLHYYGSWKWLPAAALDLEPYIFGTFAADKGLPGLTDDIVRK